MDDNWLQKIDELQVELDTLRNSRELRLGMQLRQSWLFKLVRHVRLRDRLIQISINDAYDLNLPHPEAWLLGIWCEEFPKGMPLELLEREVNQWQFYNHETVPNKQVLYTNQKVKIALYSKDENLHLDLLIQPQKGQIVVRTPSQRKTIELNSPEITTFSIYPNRHPIEIIDKTPVSKLAKNIETTPAITTTISGSQFTREDEQWLSLQGGNPQPLSLNNPDWRGILASAKELFENIYTIPDNLDKDGAQYFARLFKEAKCPSITIQGFPKTYTHLIQAVRKLLPKLPIYVIYHGNFYHMREDYDWSILQTIKKLHAEGDITKIGFVKKGMAEIMTAAGVRSAFIMNRVRQIPASASIPLQNGFHIGIWGQPDWSWKKSPYAMLASLKLVPGSIGHVYNVSPRAKQFGNLFSIPAEYTLEAVQQSQVPETLAQMHLNLYVTLTECAPMIPLESLSVGCPCLLGPTSHYFLDHEFLHQRLVVPYPDDAETISRYANRALAERAEIIHHYQNYAPDYNRRALQALAEFLEYPLREAG
jgi:hypothetical protein